MDRWAEADRQSGRGGEEGGVDVDADGVFEVALVVADQVDRAVPVVGLLDQDVGAVAGLCDGVLVGLVGWDGWAVPALLVLGFGGPEPVVGQLLSEVALDFLGRYAFTRTPAAGLRPLRDPSTDEKAADDENS